MADKKISELTAASTPLAGTEVLPIVQGGSTVKVSAADVTAGRAISALTFTSTVATGTAPFTVSSTTQVANLNAATASNLLSNATTGVLQIAGPAAAATRTMTVPDANFTVARTDAGQTFTGDQTFSRSDAVNDMTVNIRQLANNTAASANIIANNDAGAGYNNVRSLTQGGTEHWKIWGGTAASTMAFATGGTTRGRITSSGYFKISNNGTLYDSAGTYHEFNQYENAAALLVYGSNAGYTENVIFVTASRNTTNNTFYALSYFNGGAGAYKFRVADSGDVTNTNGTYGSISDAKMKTDIVDAGSQWDDIKAVRFRKFKMKDDPSDLVQLGVVAQELEQTSPGLVDEHADKDEKGNDLGTTTKSVKTSVLLMKAAVALQEAMTRIEKLESEVAALKAK